VSELACPLGELPVVDPDLPASELLGAMSRGADGRALVVRDGLLVGIVSPTDLVRHLELLELRRPRSGDHH
jgi:CBS domain-containing protein